MTAAHTTAMLSKHAQQLRDEWQARILAETKGEFFSICLAMLTHNYREAIPVLLRVVFRGFQDIKKPFFCSGASIMKDGRVVCDVIDKDGMWKNILIYDSEAHLIKAFRDIADRLKLSDADRAEMFAAVKRWVVADRRVNEEGQRQ